MHAAILVGHDANPAKADERAIRVMSVFRGAHIMNMSAR